ncbi:15-hydroxyprostaglandin dehydrogenase [NAD(+)]-like [Antedon mediterranea]|uniref:15-hydroxyprostaglandin dehydrogenase [NAD(+)]-like n=1 Tax=Antedon mediterranea TaxID=105859 RepID=UPI003AF4CA88
MEVSGKVALVTGGADGIGKAFIEELLKRNVKAVGFVDIQQSKGEATLKQLSDLYGKDKVHFIQCDVTDKQRLEEAFSDVSGRFGRLDIVCNNAGIANEEDWQKMIEINLTAVTRGTFLAIKQMSKENGGRGGVIINTSSLAGVNAVPQVPVYAATKHGVVALSRSLAANPKVTAENIRVNVLCPAFVNTVLARNLIKGLVGLPKHIEFLPLSLVAEAFMKLVEEDRTGQAMLITENGKISVHEFEEVGLK